MGWSLDIPANGLNPALDLTHGSSAGLTALNGHRMFSFEKLKVYDQALASVASLAQISAHREQTPRRRGSAAARFDRNDQRQTR